MGAEGIGWALTDQGLIDNPHIFVFGALIHRQHHNLKAGEYEIPPGASAKDIMTMLAEGKTFGRRFTIREGLTSYEIVRLLQGIEELSGEVASIPGEGTLLPQTYDYRRGETRERVIGRLEQAMTDMRATLLSHPEQQKYTPPPHIIELCKIKTKEDAKNIDDDCWHKIITLASIVEKETGVAEERRRVAGVFVNRLRKGIALQTDPTVIYAITKGKHKNDGKGPLGRRLLRKDLSYNSPYNTYKYPGLPPGPIANPGRASIEAVLNPEAHDYIFFVADGTGGHLFAKTLKEHNANVANWRKIRKQQ